MEQPKNEGLQAARAAAALSVAYFHSYIALRAFPESAQMPIGLLRDFGYLGVNFFFAISGYVICLVASRPGFTIRSFIIKRAFRLYPMYLLVMAIVACLILTSHYRSVTLANFIYSMTLLPQSGAPAYDFSWSMEREVVFYAIAAITIPVAGIYGLAAVLVLLAMLGWWYSNPWTFHIVSTTQADFLGGVLVFALRNYTGRLGFYFPLIVGAAGLYVAFSYSIPFMPPAAMAALLIAMINLKLDWKRWPGRWIVTMGDASYSIYLLHYLTFAVMVQIAAGFHLPGWICEPWRYLALLLCCLTSVHTWRWIERPMIDVGNRYAVRGGRQESQPAAAMTD